MRNLIHISVLLLYLVTSCCVIPRNKWLTAGDAAHESFTDLLITSMTIPVSDDASDENDIPFLFKDPTEDDSVILDYYPLFVDFEFTCIHFFTHIEERIKDPLLHIFSPPPQLY